MVDRFTEDIVARELDQESSISVIEKISNIDALCALFE